MIKFVIGLIALIFIALSVYVYTDKNTEEITKSIVTNNKEETIKAVPVKIIPKKVTHSKVDTTKHKVTSMKETVSSVENTANMEMDNNTLIMDEAYHPNINQTSDEEISDEELNDIEEHMLQSGQINQDNDFSASTENLGYDPSELAGKL